MAKKNGVKAMVDNWDQIDDKIRECVGDEFDKHIRKLSKVTNHARTRAVEFQREAKKRTATAIAAAFSFIIALFWRDAITDILNKVLEELGLTGSTYIAKVLAALVVTLIGIIAIMKISKWGEVEK